MATTYSYGGGNTTASSSTLAPIKLGLETNYGEIRPEGEPVKPGTIWLSNGTCASDIDERIKFSCKAQRGISDLKVPVRYPATIKDVVVYTVDTQMILRETRDDGTIIDHPIKFKTTICHDIVAPFTEVPNLGTSYVNKGLMRHLGCFFHDDGTERFAELAKSLLNPSD